MEQSAYGRLVHSIYQGVLAEQGWEGCLEGLKRLTDSETVGLLMWDKRASIVLVSAGAGADQSLISDYEHHYSRFDPTLDVVPSKEVCEWYIDARDFGLEAMRTSAYYQEFLHHHGIGWVGAIPLMRTPDVEIGLSFQRAASAIPYDSTTVEVLKPYLVHLQQATYMHWRYNAVLQEAALAKSALNQLRFPLLVVDARGTILMSNPAADEWLRRQDIFRRHEHNLQMHWYARFIQMAKTICGDQNSCARVSSLRIDPTEHSPQACLVGIPLPAEGSLASGYGRPVGIVIIHTASAESPAIGDILHSLFALTPAEVRVAEGLVAGITVNELAEQCSLSRETIRSQLKSVYIKLGVRKQSDLIKLVDGLSHTRMPPT